MNLQTEKVQLHIPDAGCNRPVSNLFPLNRIVFIRTNFIELERFKMQQSIYLLVDIW
jgi:hypothetical protein